MGQTITEKILSRASSTTVRQGDFGWAQVHVVSMMDLVHFCDWDFFDRNKVTVWDPRRILFCFDHFMYPSFGLGVSGLEKLRDWARRHGVPAENVFDIGRQGNSHQIPAEYGWALPGTVYAGADSQAATLGAMNCFTFASNADTPYVMATGKTWFKVPDSIRVNLQGQLPRGILGKDIHQRMLQELRGKAEGRVIEVGGPGLSSLPVDIRMSVANGAPHLGADTIVFEADHVLLDYLAPRARESFTPASADTDANYVYTLDLDLGAIEPMISGPGDPYKIRPLGLVGDVQIQAAYIGSCASGRMEDLAMAAQVMKGHKVAPGVRMVVTPVSSKVMQEAMVAGYLATLMEAGATVTSPGCGACYLGNQSPLHLSAHETCVSTSVENWPGRMGSNQADIYLANAATVAASAIEGRLVSAASYLQSKGMK